jgi:phosphonate transport system permease protein
VTNTRFPRPKPPPAGATRLITIGVVALLAWSAVTIEIRVGRLDDLPVALAFIFNRMFLERGPEWAYLPQAFGAMLQSIQIAWLGTLIGAVLSLPLGFFGARNVSGRLASNAVRQLLNAVRAVPEILLAVVVFIPIVGIGGTAGAYAGTLAIGIHSIGTLGKLTAEVVEGIDPGPVEAARATGAGPLQVQRWGVLPQVLPDIVAFWLYRFEINVRASAVLGVLGAGGIGTVLVDALAFRRFDRAGIAIIVIIVVTVLIDAASGWLRRRIIEGGAARPGRPADLEQPELREAAAG